MTPDWRGTGEADEQLQSADCVSALETGLAPPFKCCHGDVAAATTLNPIMSRGLGHTEGTILQMVERQHRRKQRVSFSALDIVLNSYPHREGRDSRAHFVAVHRAMHSFARKHPQYALVGGKGGHWASFRVGRGRNRLLFHRGWRAQDV